jgi:TonB family protein
MSMSFHALQTKTTARIAVLACIAGFALPAAAKKNKLNPAAVALFEKAIQESDLRGKDGTAFRLQATIHIFDWQRQRIDGILVEFWAPEKKTRSEVLFSGYNDLEVNDGHHWWRKASGEYMPYPVSELRNAMQFAGSLKTMLPPAPEDAPAKQAGQERNPDRIELSKPEKEKGTSWVCVRTNNWRGSKAHLCFDPATGHLTRILDDLRYEYDDYQAFGKKSFPRTIRILYADGTEMGELQVTRIDALDNPDPSLFGPVAGAKEKATNGTACGGSKTAGKNKVAAAKLTRMVRPVYPAEAQRHGISGRVVIHAVIGKDGVPHALWVVRSPAPILSAAALAAASQWQYQPTLLCGEPVPVDTMLTVIFTLR